MAILKAIRAGDEEMVFKLLDQDLWLLEEHDMNGDWPLRIAARYGKLGVMRLLEQWGANFNARGAHAKTALHWAAEGGHEAVVAFLLSKGVRTDVYAHHGKTPLRLACEGGHLGVVRMLVQHIGRRDVDAGIVAAATALRWAVRNGHEELANFLLTNWAQVGKVRIHGATALMEACAGGHVGVVRLLVHHMGRGFCLGIVRRLVQLVTGEGLEETDNQGHTALYHAAIWGHGEVVAIMLSSGAQANIRDLEGGTALMGASMWGQLGVVQTLVQHMGTQGLEDKDRRGCTALHHAARWSEEDVVDFLLSKGALASNKDLRGRTPLIEASSEGYLGVVQTLTQHMGTEGLEDMDFMGETALYHAAIGGHEEILTFLLSRGAQANTGDAEIGTALMGASMWGHLGVVQTLVQHTGEEGLEDQNPRGHTALQLAAIKGHEEIVDFLLSRGARANSRDTLGMTALVHASLWGHLGVVRTIVEHMGEEWVEATDGLGQTAFYHAAVMGHEKIVAFILSKRTQATSRARDHENATALMKAVASGHLGVVRVLVHHMGRQRLDTRHESGRTALYMAALRDREEMVRFLLVSGADPSIGDNKGRTPRAVAEKRRPGCGAAFQWWEGELERRCLLYRATCLNKAYTTQRALPSSPQVIPQVPTYLAARSAVGHALPSVEVVSLESDKQQAQGGASGKRRAAEEEADSQQAEVGREEVQAVVGYVVKGLNEELLTELLEGFHRATE